MTITHFIDQARRGVGSLAPRCTEKPGFEPRCTGSSRQPLGPRAADASQRGLGVAAAFLRAQSPHLSHRQRAIGGPGSRPQPRWIPSPSRPRRATGLESHRHGPPRCSPAPLSLRDLETVRWSPPWGEGRGREGCGGVGASRPPPARSGLHLPAFLLRGPHGPAPAPTRLRAPGRPPAPPPGPRSRPRVAMPKRVFRPAEPQPAAQAGHPPGKAAGKTRHKSRPRAERSCDPVRSPLRSPSAERAHLEVQVGRPNRSEARRGPETSGA